MAFNLGKKLRALFSSFTGSGTQDKPEPQGNQSRSSVYAQGSPEQQAEYDACTERLVAATIALKTLDLSPEYKPLLDADGEYTLRRHHMLLDNAITAAARFKSGNPALGENFPDMTTAINTVGGLAETIENLHKSKTSYMATSAKTAAARAKPAQPCCA